jgi:GNAT superfamily N-acetyltransferase
MSTPPRARVSAGILPTVESRVPGGGVVVIRSARPTDAAQLVALLEYGALTANQEDGADIEAYRSALADIQATAGNDVLVAEVGGEPVGMCQLIVFRHFQHHGGRSAEIESMHVHPGFRSMGIGAQLLEAAVGAARRAGCYRVQLMSNVRRTEAHRFYERQGFVPSHLGFKRWIEPEP